MMIAARGVRAGMAALILAACDPAPSVAEPPRQTPATPSERRTMIVRIVSREDILTVRLADTPTARDFAALLPLTLDLADYNRTEKIADLPRALSRDGAPDAVTPVAGDLAYYAPWGNLAIFYRDFGRSPGLVRLGRIERNAALIATLAGPVRIERAP